MRKHIPQYAITEVALCVFLFQLDLEVLLALIRTEKFPPCGAPYRPPGHNAVFGWSLKFYFSPFQSTTCKFLSLSKVFLVLLDTFGFTQFFDEPRHSACAHFHLRPEYMLAMYFKPQTCWSFTLLHVATCEEDVESTSLICSVLFFVVVAVLCLQ